MLKKFLINRYKNFKQRKELNRDLSYKEQYAFIGAGNHSLENLYPCIQHLALPLKYICTENISNAKKIALRFQGCTGTDHISDILEDPQVKGVFVCMPPVLHYETIKKLFSASKHVFVEKPPCYSASELRELILVQQSNIFVPGFQKRFCRINGLLSKKTSGTTSYHCRYLSGPYPDGDSLFELFIHPIDNLIQLFGQADIKFVSKIKTGNSVTVFLFLNHVNGAFGSVELSTNYSWNQPIDLLEMNNETEILTANYPNYLAGVDKTKYLFGLPLEKVLKQPVTQKIYFNNTGFSPVSENNSLVVQGFLGEVEYFVHSVEKKIGDRENKLTGLKNLYEILESIQRAG